MTIRIRPRSRGPIVHGRQPVLHGGVVHRSAHHPFGTGRHQPQARREPQRRGTSQYHSLAQVLLRRGRTNRCVCWAVRTRSCVKEKCSFKSKGLVNPVVIRRCVARRNGTRGGWRCSTARPHPRTRVPCLQWSATNLRRWSSRAQGFWASMNRS